MSGVSPDLLKTKLIFGCMLDMLIAPLRPYMVPYAIKWLNYRYRLGEATAAKDSIQTANRDVKSSRFSRMYTGQSSLYHSWIN